MFSEPVCLLTGPFRLEFSTASLQWIDSEVKGIDLEQLPPKVPFGFGSLTHSHLNAFSRSPEVSIDAPNNSKAVRLSVRMLKGLQVATKYPQGKIDLMAILVDKTTRVIVCGMTGKEGGFHSQQMIEYGTQVVAGVTPGKGGTMHLGLPIFDTVEEAVNATHANASIIFVPGPYAADSVLECEAAGLPFVTLISDWIPIHDEIRMVNRVHANGTTRLLGGNCAGIITPGECKMGIMPGNIFKPGDVGLVSRSGTLTYEIVWEMTRADFGQTTCVGIGGDPLPGTRFIEVMEMFEADPKTKAVVMIGEIGGSDEETACEFIKTMSKPVVGFISGRTAPPGKRMGHAGAIISGNTGTPQSKVDAFLSAGASVADRTSDIPRLLSEAMARI